MKKLRLAALLAALTLVLTGCGPAEGEEASPAPSSSPPVEESAAPAAFTLPYTEESLHPIFSTDKINLTLSGLLWEGLFTMDQSFEPHPLLCQSYAVSEDGLTWTFTLRSGVTFSDGSPLTAAEVAASLELARGSGSRFQQRLSGITGVEAGEGFVTVTLSAPNGALPALLDVPIVKGEGDVPLGTGPYVLESLGSAARLTARSGWWQEKSLPAPSISLLAVHEADDLLYTFSTGDVSLVAADLTGTGALGFTGDNQIVDYPTSSMVFLGYNCASGPCANSSLRRALDRGLDRNTVAAALYSRHAQAAELPVSPASLLWDEARAEERSYSPQAMEELLAQAGYEKNSEGVWSSGRRTLSLTMVVSTGNTFRLSAAEYLASELTKAGIQVELQKLSWEEYLAALTAGDFDLYVGETLLTAAFDLSPLLQPGGTLNYGRYQSAQTSALLSAYQAAFGEARTAAAGALWDALAQEVPFSTLCFKNWSVLTHWGRVSGLTPTQQNLFYGLENWTIS